MLRLSTSLLFAVLLPSLPLSAQSFGLYAHVGTLGGGAEVGIGLSDVLTVRLGGNFLEYARTETFDDGEFNLDADLNLSTFSGLVDYHPAGIAMRVTAGLVYNQNEASGLLTTNRIYYIGNRRYDPADIGSLDVRVRGGNELSPYFGFGFGRTVPRRRLGVTLDLGILYHGKIDVEMQGTGAMSPTADQAEEIEDELKNAEFFPVVMFGLTFRLAGSR